MTDSDTICIQFNGQAIDLPAGSSVAELLRQVEMRSQLVAVEVNMDIVPRSEHAQHQLQAGDVVEAVTLVGGG